MPSGDPDVLQGIDHPEERCDRHNLRCVKLDSISVRIKAGQETAGRGVVEGIPIVEGDRALDGLDGIVVEERAGARRLYQRWHLERAVTWTTEPVIPWDEFASQAAWLVRKIFDARIEVRVPEVALAKIRRRSGIHVAEVTLARSVVEEELLPSLRDRALEPQRQGQILLSSQ